MRTILALCALLCTAADALRLLPHLSLPNHVGPARSVCARALMAAGVQVQSLRPMLLPVDPQATPTQHFALEGSALSAPAWLDERATVALLDRGRQYLWSTEDGSMVELPSGDVERYDHAAVADNLLAVCGAAGLSAVNIDTSAASELALSGVSDFVAVTAVLPVAEKKLLLAFAEVGEMEAFLLSVACTMPRRLVPRAQLHAPPLSAATGRQQRGGVP
jgi:hypothetical protein